MNTLTLRCAFLIAGMAFAAYSQPAGPLPVFDVASVKPSQTDATSGSTTDGNGSLTIRNVPLRSCIANAFGVKYDQVHGPSWLDSARFDIIAKAASPGGDVMKMLQALLIERFAMKTHVETKDVSGFAMRIAAGGLKVESIGDKPRGGRMMLSPPGHLSTVSGLTMSRLADEIGRRLGVPVVDMTGKPGYFVFSLEFSEVDTGTQMAPSLPDALKSQAGLQLESAKVPVTFVVVDSIEKTPTEN